MPRSHRGPRWVVLAAGALLVTLIAGTTPGAAAPPSARAALDAPAGLPAAHAMVPASSPDRPERATIVAPYAPALGPRSDLDLFYQWVGAATDPLTPGQVAGIGSTVDVLAPPVPCAAPGYANFDRSSVEISTTPSLYSNVGFFLDNNSLGPSSCSTSGPYPYYRDAAGNFQVVCSLGTLTDGPHSFNASNLAGTTRWEFFVDGAPIQGTTFNWSSGQCTGPAVDGEVDLGSPTANLSTLWSALKEETTDSNQSFWPVPEVLFPTAFSVLRGGNWSDVPVGWTTRVSTTASPPAFGVEGALQNSSLRPDEIRAGTGIPWPENLSVLWAPPLEVLLEVAPETGTVPLDVSCSAVISGGTGSYPALTWSFGDGSNSTQSSPRHVYDRAGTYEVALEVTDSGGERDAAVPVMVQATGAPRGTGTHASTSAELEWAIAGVSLAAVIAAVIGWRRRRARAG